MKYISQNTTIAILKMVEVWSWGKIKVVLFLKSVCNTQNVMSAIL